MIQIGVSGVPGGRDQVRVEVTAGSATLFVVQGDRDVALDALAAYVVSLKNRALGQ